MIPIVAYGIMGTTYKQEVVVDDGVRENGSLKVLQDIRRHLSMQYGDDTPMTGWALQPAPGGMWLTRIERAFDANYAPAYIAIAFLIPFGNILQSEALQRIEQSLAIHHTNYIRQSVVQHDADWRFLFELDKELEGLLVSVGEVYNTGCACPSDRVAYWNGDMPSLLCNMWDERFTQYKIIYCGKQILSPYKDFVLIESGSPVSSSYVAEEEAPLAPEETTVYDIENATNDAPCFEENESFFDMPLEKTAVDGEDTNHFNVTKNGSLHKNVSRNSTHHGKGIRFMIGGAIVLVFIVVIAVLVSKPKKNQSLADNNDLQTETTLNLMDTVASNVSQNSDETFTVKGVVFLMKYVEGGTFQMGADDKDAWDDDKPIHSVTVSSFHIGETEVTQALWLAVMGENPSRIKGDSLPVEKVSWNDCQEFIRELNRLTGKNFRLPTEAEWEYAARGGEHHSPYRYAGSDNIRDVAWYWDNSNRKTHPVKMKQANALGLYDMSGNVFEWCEDWLGKYSSHPQTNPTGASTGSCRVVRGGGWIDVSSSRVSRRIGDSPGDRLNYIGFRLAM